jgi:hypothetical protein
VVSNFSEELVATVFSVDVHSSTAQKTKVDEYIINLRDIAYKGVD